MANEDIFWGYTGGLIPSHLICISDVVCYLLLMKIKKNQN